MLVASPSAVRLVHTYRTPGKSTCEPALYQIFRALLVRLLHLGLRADLRRPLHGWSGGVMVHQTRRFMTLGDDAAGAVGMRSGCGHDTRVAAVVIATCGQMQSGRWEICRGAARVVLPGPSRVNVRMSWVRIRKRLSCVVDVQNVISLGCSVLIPAPDVKRKLFHPATTVPGRQPPDNCILSAHLVSDRLVGQVM